MLPEFRGLRDGTDVTLVGAHPNYGDVEALAQSCVALLADPSRREAFGRHGRGWARSHFDRGAIVARYREVYRATLTPGGASVYRPGEALDGKVDA